MSLYRCLNCGQQVYREPGESMPRGDERCSHEFEVEQRYEPPTCLKCGARKTYELFKGEYCPRCNDWC